jgi:hypothetical protein
MRLKKAMNMTEQYPQALCCHEAGARDSSHRRFCKRQLDRVDSVFERLTERPLLPFRDHKPALDRHRPGLDLDDDLNA